MGFLKDLKEGKDFESVVRNHLNDTFRLKMEENEDKMGVDITSESLSIEVKYDRMMRTTGNLFIEFECNKKPSGLFKDESATLLAYGDYDGVLIFEVEQLRDEFPRLIEEFRTSNGGDGWRSKGLLLPISEARKLAKGEIFINQ